MRRNNSTQSSICRSSKQANAWNVLG